MKTALLEITKAKGAYKRDPLEFARSVIIDIHGIASKALEAIGETPHALE